VFLCVTVVSADRWQGAGRVQHGFDGPRAQWKLSRSQWRQISCGTV